MDKGNFNDDSSSISGSSNSNSSSTNLYLKQLNRSSLKITKPIRRAAAIPDLEPNPAHLPPSQQPPVYNVSKKDFREVVQKLTGSPAHERHPAPIPAPVTQSRPSSSRLQRIRPPPLAQIVNRPPIVDLGRLSEVQSFTPLPPLPSVHPAAESPISAYMRFLSSSGPSPPAWNDVAPQLPAAESPMSNYMRFLQNSASAASPRWNASAPQQQNFPPPAQSQAQFPSYPGSLSPLPFGCIPLPRSPYAVFSPTGQLGFPQLPSSPVQSPRVKGI